jgi:type I restriction enzyme S subunit
VGLPIIKIKELKSGVQEGTPRCNESELDPRYVVETGDLLFSWSADLGVYLWPGDRGALNQHLFKVTSAGSVSIDFLFYALREALPEFQRRAQGTTMRHIKRSALSEVAIAVPTQDLMSLFSDQVRPIHQQLATLQSVTRKLIAARDLLLPRLLTGKLDISEVDLGVLTPSSTEAA